MDTGRTVDAGAGVPEQGVAGCREYRGAGDTGGVGAGVPEPGVSGYREYRVPVLGYRSRGSRGTGPISTGVSGVPGCRCRSRIGGGAAPPRRGGGRCGPGPVPGSLRALRSERGHGGGPGGYGGRGPRPGTGTGGGGAGQGSTNGCVLLISPRRGGDPAAAAAHREEGGGCGTPGSSPGARGELRFRRFRPPAASAAPAAAAAGFRPPKSPERGPEPGRARLRVPGGGGASLQRQCLGKSLGKSPLAGGRARHNLGFSAGKRGESRRCILPWGAGMGRALPAALGRAGGSGRWGKGGAQMCVPGAGGWRSASRRAPPPRASLTLLVCALFRAWSCPCLSRVSQPSPRSIESRSRVLPGTGAPRAVVVSCPRCVPAGHLPGCRREGGLWCFVSGVTSIPLSGSQGVSEAAWGREEQSRGWWVWGG